MGAQPPGYSTPPPPPPGYPPAGAQPGYAAVAPAGYANQDEKTWALIAHFGGIVTGFIAPLVAYLVKGQESPTVKAHALEALNFQITWSVAFLISIILAICTVGILFFLPFVAWVVVVVFGIIGGLRANEGQLYHYPMSVRLIK
jgi:uncharacterized Tic20 family protein